MANTLRFKRGLASGLPTGLAGEPLFTTDTFDLYIGNGSGNTRFQKYIASGTTSQILRGDGSLYTFPLAISSPTNGQVLKYNGTSWVNDSDSGITGSGSAGQVAYFTGATTQAGSNNLFWDAANSRLGINTNAPYIPFQIGTTPASSLQSSQSAISLTYNSPSGTGNSLRQDFIIAGDTPTARSIIIGTRTRGTISSPLAVQSGDVVFSIIGNAFDGTSTQASGVIQFEAESNASAGSAPQVINFITGSSGASRTTKMQLRSNGNLILQSGGTFADSGQRLQVIGTGYFSDNTAIGNTTLIARTNLTVWKNITGDPTSFGVYSRGTIQSGVTTDASYYASVSETAAASFTLAALKHYRAVNAGFGAGSTVTNQYAFIAESSITGATNNFGFYGDIAAATGRWNLYMNGSANNYLNGNTSIGTTTMRGKFQVKLGVATAASTIASSGFDNTYALFGNPDTLSGQCFGIGARTTLDGINLISLNPTSDWVDTNYYSRQHIFYGTAIEGMRLTTLRNLHIGTFSADSGEKLQVTGTMKVTGAASIGSTTSISGTAYTLLALNNTNAVDWGTHISFAGNGTVFGYFGSVGSLLGNTTKDLTVYATAGNGFRVYTNGNNLRATIDTSGNLGLGVTPSAWSGVRALQVGANAAIINNSANSSSFVHNGFYNGTNFVYLVSSQQASYLAQTNGAFQFFTAPSGTAGNAITFTQAMTLDASGNLLLGSTTSSGERLQVTGTAKIGSYSTTGYSLVVQNNGANDVSGIRISTGATVDGYLSLAYDATNTYGSIQAGDNNVFRNIVINRQGGSVGIGANPNNSAVLQADSTTRGFLPPRMTTTQRNAIATPAAGLVVYDTTTNKLCCYNGTSWNDLF